jgi:hypothetical protein
MQHRPERIEKGHEIVIISGTKEISAFSLADMQFRRLLKYLSNHSIYS